MVALMRLGDMGPTLLQFVFLLLLVPCWGKCRFPKEWKGRWYQSGLGDVIIRSNSIQKKGNCIEHRRDYYLMENEDEKCFQCLLMIKRHRNIIQYKESYCMPASELRSLCSRIRVEDILYTLVREPTTPIPPPFEESYKVNYNDGHFGDCPDPQSTAKPCAGQDKVNFHFEHCSGRAMWHGADLSFEVLGEWRDGSDNYMYGKFAGNVIGTKDSSYRCFKYENYGTDLYLAMSADATCRGLRSPRDGPITMHFTRDVSGKPEPRCEFPVWMQRTWSDLAGKFLYSLDEAMSTLSMMRHWDEELVGDEGSTEELQSQIGCLDIHEDMHKKEIVIAGFSTHECDIRYQCIKIRQLPHNVIALYKGEMTSHLPDIHHCKRQQGHNTEYIILTDTATPPQPSPCPLRGQYHMPGVSESCDAHLDMGCRNTSSLDILFSCSPQTEYLGCLSWWQEENNTYMLTAMDHIGRSITNCWVFSRAAHTLRLDTEMCNKGAISILPYSMQLQTLHKTECENPVPTEPVPEEEKEPERIIIDREDTQQPNNNNPQDGAQDSGGTAGGSGYNNVDEEGGYRDSSSKHRQDRTENSGQGMYRTSSDATSLLFTNSQHSILLVLLVSVFVKRFCCR